MDTQYTTDFADELSDKVQQMIREGHIQDEKGQGIVCNYKTFAIVVNDGAGAIVGALQGYTAFSEVYVEDIWVQPKHRNKGLGKHLLSVLEQKFRGKGFDNINLVTSHFQAPDFYKKCGFTKEFVRTNEHHPKLTKTFFIKPFNEGHPHQGIISDEDTTG